MICKSGSSRVQDGSVLIIVLWVSFGLVSIALYFANSMSLELRAADNRVAGLEAEQAIDGAMRYTTYLLANTEQTGRLPDALTYQREEVRVGEARFWFLGREQAPRTTAEPFFGLADECARLNVNTASSAMLENLPRMTPELAAAIIDWRDSNSEVSTGGAEDETYLRQRPAYKAKNGPFESIDELRLVFGMELDILYGEDINQNGIVNPNENDGDLSWPPDNRDGRLDPGLAEYLTVHNPQAAPRADGSPRINVINGAARPQLAALLEEKFGGERSGQLMGALGQGGINSVLELQIRSGMSAVEFAQIAGDVIASNAQTPPALVNIHTASAEVLACIPGIDSSKAEAIVSYRQSNADNLDSPSWITEILGESMAQAAPFLTTATMLFRADICALGRYGRGYRRMLFVIDANGDAPKILSRRDLTHLGWAMGRSVLEHRALEERML